MQFSFYRRKKIKFFGIKCWKYSEEYTTIAHTAHTTFEKVFMHEDRSYTITSQCHLCTVMGKDWFLDQMMYVSKKKLSPSSCSPTLVLWGKKKCGKEKKKTRIKTPSSPSTCLRLYHSTRDFRAHFFKNWGLGSGKYCINFCEKCIETWMLIRSEGSIDTKDMCTMLLLLKHPESLFSLTLHRQIPLTLEYTNTYVHQHKI